MRSDLGAAGDDISQPEALQREVAWLKGHVAALEERLAAQDAADEHHRAELETARAEAADLRVALKDAQVRAEEWRRRVADAEASVQAAEQARAQAEQERAAVIAALGRRARKHLGADES